MKTIKCSHCNTDIELTIHNKKYCNNQCFLDATRSRRLEKGRARRSNPLVWEAEKARSRERLKTEKWRSYYRKLLKERGKTLEGRVIVFNNHVLQRGQSKLKISAAAIRNKFGEMDQWMCSYCLTRDDLTFDHILPFHHDGKHVIENLQILCRSCNSTKGCYERHRGRNQQSKTSPI